MRLPLWVRAYPTMLRVGIAEAVAYRAELFVWMLSTTMPFVNLAFWKAVEHAGGPIAGWGGRQLSAYFFASFVVRQFASSWLAWEMNRELRTGIFSMRLLRPVHPLVGYSADHLAAIPMRSLIAVPVFFVALFAAAPRLSHDALVWAAVPVAIFNAWLITFLANAIFAALGFWLEQSLVFVDVWLAAFFALSGYMFPLDFLASWPRVAAILRALPFYYMNGFPIELLVGAHDRASAWLHVGAQLAWVAALGAATALIWRAGTKRWNAYGA